MKKQLVGLLIGAITFLGGILVTSIFLIKHEMIFTLPKIEEIKLEEFKDEKKPSLEVASRDEEKSIESTDAFIIRNVHSWYSLDDYGDKMREVAMINLFVESNDENGNLTEQVILKSGIYTNLTDDIDESYAEQEWTAFDGKTVKFKTKKLKGIVYSFEGTFIKNKTEGEYEEELLRGVLRKYVKGKKVAEVKGNFKYVEPRCLR